MSLIRVIAKKIGKFTIGDNDLRLAQYMNNLTMEASKHPGYISSNSHWEFNPNFNKQNYSVIGNIYTISDWKSQSHWNTWLNSGERKVIQSNFKDVIEHEEFTLLYVNKYKEDGTFLSPPLL